MVAFLSIVLALSLLGIIVYGLHKYQTMEVEYHVDRTMPLPPIDGARRKHSSPESGMGTAGESTRSRVRSNSRGTGKSSRLAANSGQVQRPRKAGWQDQLAKAKNVGNFELAKQLCRQQFPLWSAFNQACITIRGQLKTIDLGSESAAKLLLELYRTAAMAELLHDKSEQAESFKLHQLRSIDQAALAQLDFPYTEIGYAQLRLIRKSDVKMMLASWGRPQGHKYPREQYAQWWESQVSSLRGH